MISICTKRIAAVIGDRWSSFMSARRHCLHEGTLDNIHDLRVATRRLRAAIRVVAGFDGAGHSGRVYGIIKNITRETGALRNLDEALLFVRCNCIGTDSGSPAFSQVMHELELRRKDEFEKLRHVLKNSAFESAQSDLDQIADHIDSYLSDNLHSAHMSAFVAYLSKCNLELFSRVEEHLLHSRHPGAVRTRHELRIAMKKWRYYLEIMAELTGRDYSHILELLKQYQSILGRLNDLQVFMDLLVDIGMTEEELSLFQAVYDKSTGDLYDRFTELEQQHPFFYEFRL